MENFKLFIMKKQQEEYSSQPSGQNRRKSSL